MGEERDGESKGERGERKRERCVNKL